MDSVILSRRCLFLFVQMDVIQHPFWVLDLKLLPVTPGGVCSAPWGTYEKIFNQIVVFDTFFITNHAYNIQYGWVWHVASNDPLCTISTEIYRHHNL